MTDAEAIWAARSDDELLEAAEALSEYTEEGERIIRLELRRRGLPEPPPPVGTCAHCGWSIAASYTGDCCPECGEAFPAELLQLLDAGSSEEVLGPRAGDGDLIPIAKSLLEGTLRWLRPAAEQGDAEAQYSLGVMYDTGLGITQDLAEAARWYRPAAEQGYAPAQNNLGLMYSAGEGVPQDATEALRWYRLAAEQGYAAAQFNVGVVYHTGEGVLKDAAEAMKWYRLAADQGLAAAQSVLAQIDSDKSPSVY